MSNKKYWLHRITGGENAASYTYNLLFYNPEKKMGYISIGWSDFSSDEFANAVHNHGEDVLNKVFAENGWGRPRNRWNLWRFLRAMKPGDVVVVPTAYELQICEIADDQIFSNESIDITLLHDRAGNQAKLNDDGRHLYNSSGQPIDLGFYRKVKLIETHIQRSFADAKLSSRMKIRQTNADITDIADSVERTRLAFKEGKPIQLKEILFKDIAEKVREDIRNNLNDNKFEELIDWYLKSLGADRVDTPRKNESPTERGDADRVAYFERLHLVIMVQAKFHTGYTDEWAVEGFTATLQEYRDRLALIEENDNSDNDFNIDKTLDELSDMKDELQVIDEQLRSAEREMNQQFPKGKNIDKEERDIYKCQNLLDKVKKKVKILEYEITGYDEQEMWQMMYPDEDIDSPEFQDGFDIDDFFKDD